jgi:hypothetical protein
MRRLYPRHFFSRSLLLLFAILAPCLAPAAPQAAAKAALQQASTKSASPAVAPHKLHPFVIFRAKSASKAKPAAQSKSSAQDDGVPSLTPPEWYLQNAEIPKQIADTTGTPFPLTITNQGTTPVVVTSISGTNEEFTFGGTCTSSDGIPAGGTCILEVSYDPETPCELSSVEITFTDNDAGGDLVLELGSYGAGAGGITTDDLRDTSLSATQLAQSLVGPGITISNVTYTGTPWSLGTFAGGNGIIGFDKGIVLSNGAVSNVIGPNCSQGITQSNATPGDTDLSNLIGQVTNDAAVLEFDFVPTSPTISFQYVFASDEYQDYVFDYNDVFAFFLGQPGSTTDIALIPGTNTIVSINNVNNGSTDPGNITIPPVNPQFYVNNDFQFPTVAPFDTEMDGMTVVLTATATVAPGQTNHIKLAVADAIDTAYDSNVFIRAGSLVSSVVSPAPTALAFGNVNVATASPAQSVTITNVGSAPLTSLAITTSAAAFAQTNNCGTSLAAGASCTINVTFTSATAGLVQGNIQIADNAPDSPQLISVSATAISGPYVTFSPTSLTFGPQAPGTVSPAQIITVTNTGTSGLNITGVTMLSAQFDEGSEYSFTNNCPDTTIAPKATCTISVTYTPDEDSAPPDIDGIVLADNAQNQGTQTVGLNGGVTVSIATSPASLAFGNQKINTTSAAQTITISNPASNTGTVSIASVIVTAGYTETNNCAGVQLAPDSSCAVNVTFTPTVAQAYAGSVVITDSAPGSPQTIPLSGTGTGVNSPVVITIAPGSSDTASSVPGGTAYYGLIITAVPGFTGTVQLGCTPSSDLITCTAVPSTITLSASGTTEVAFAIQTYCKGTTTNTGSLPIFPGSFGTGLALFLVTLALGGATWTFHRKPQIALAFATLLLVILGSAACSGGPAKGPNGITPAGTYYLSLSVTTSGGTVIQPNFLKLIVN